MIARHELTFNAFYGQSFVFFVQVKAAISGLPYQGSCGGCDSLHAAAIKKQKRREPLIFIVVFVLPATH